METLFVHTGLVINRPKTKALTSLPKISTTNISTVAYKHHMDGVGNTYRERKKWQTTCNICDTRLQLRNLCTHYKLHHPMIPAPIMDKPLPPLLYVTPVDYILTKPDKHADMQCPIPECGVMVVGGWYNM